MSYQAHNKTATLYLNGQVAAESTKFNLTLSSLGNITQPWLGRASWLLPLTDGRFKHFSFYTGRLRSVHPGKIVANPYGW